jgi:hypothetical protein
MIASLGWFGSTGGVVPFVALVEGISVVISSAAV